MAESWGNLWRSRSACVPFPTPGAPTRIIRAAFLSLLFIMVVMIAFFGGKVKTLVVMEYYALFRMPGASYVSYVLANADWVMVPPPGRQM